MRGGRWVICTHAEMTFVLSSLHMPACAYTCVCCWFARCWPPGAQVRRRHPREPGLEPYDDHVLQRRLQHRAGRRPRMPAGAGSAVQACVQCRHRHACMHASERVGMHNRIMRRMRLTQKLGATPHPHWCPFGSSRLLPMRSGGGGGAAPCMHAALILTCLLHRPCVVLQCGVL